MATDLEEKIVQQVEYYFGNINLPRDKFLQEKIRDDDGWITLETLLTFKRLASLSSDPKVIAEALEKVEDKLVLVSEDKSKVKRNPDKPLPVNDGEHLQQLQVRSAYAKGFPRDEQLHDILNFMKPHGSEAVIRRTTKDHKFKGSCFIVFKTLELAKKFVEAESVKYKDTELIRKMQVDYHTNKKKEVLLQNIHLSLPFATEVAAMILDGENMNETFRIWLTTEVHEAFPIGLLQMAIKFTNEPPQGIRASMKRTYQNITQDYLDYSAQYQWPPLLYAVAFLHTVLQERRKFGPLGWNVPYEFNQADFAASVQFVQNHLDDMDPKKGVSWPTVCYMLGEVQYGGRVTDDFDKRLLVTFTQVWFCDVLLRPGFEFYKGYKIPQTRNLSGFLDYINSLPATDSPEVFGLHANADITYQIQTAKAILDTILNVQPKEGGGGGGETRESVVYCLAEDMLAKLPEVYNAFEVKEALIRMGPLLPMNIFLRQEIDRIQKVIKEVKSTLTDLKLAIDGTIVMSQNLRTALNSMYDARIPERWKKVSWESATLGFWYTELLERDAQFRSWCNNGRPNVFWMTGFFNPQGFLTAMRQDVTRAHKGWALDSVVLQNMITRYNKEDVKDGPNEGVYVYGLFLEGASLDRRSGKLIESKPKVLYEQMPVIYIYAINTTAGKDPKLYECPIYRKPQRTDQKYVGSIDFETDHNPRHWTLRGVALLCDIK